MNLSDLKAPFPPESISWRVGPMNSKKSQGMALAYINARDVMGRLDEVCGPEGWQTRHIDVGGGKLACEVGIWLNTGDSRAQGWVWKSDGAGSTDVEAEKGAFSDSFKRAAVQWGIGRYLYDLPEIWVALGEKYGRPVIADSEYPRLSALLGKEPEPKKVMSGELGLSQLKKAMRDFSTDLQAVEDYDALVLLLNSTLKLQDQCRVDLHEWWLKAEGAIDTRKAVLAELDEQTRLMGAG